MNAQTQAAQHTPKPTISQFRDSIVAVTDKSEAGAVAFWELSGALNLESLRQVWSRHQLPEKWLPNPPTANVALSYAVHEADSRRLLARPFKGGWAMVREVEKDDDLAYSTELRVSVGDAGTGLVFNPPNHPLRIELSAAWAKHLGQLNTAEASSWLCTLVDRLQAVALRDRGGFYFLPRGPELDTWRKVVAALREVSSHTMREIPAMTSQEAVAAILAAVSREAEAEAKVAEELRLNPETGKRALGTRAKRIDAMITKVERYEQLLGCALPELEQRLRVLHRNLAAAAMMGAGQ